MNFCLWLKGAGVFEKRKAFLNAYHNLSNFNSSLKLLIKAKAASAEKNGKSSAVDTVTFCESSSIT